MNDFAFILKGGPGSGRHKVTSYTVSGYKDDNLYHNFNIEQQDPQQITSGIRRYTVTLNNDPTIKSSRAQTGMSVTNRGKSLNPTSGLGKELVAVAREHIAQHPEVYNAFIEGNK